MQWPTVAVLIPTLNEEASLPAALASVRSQNVGVRLLIADGGSTDGTKAVSEKSGAKFIATSKKGRGCQIAAALVDLAEDVVLVLHADATLPPNAIERIQRWMAIHPRCPGGCLGHRFESPRLIYRLIELWDSLRARLGTAFGDQAQFFRRELIEQSGGFPNQPIMEDWELSRRLASLGRTVYLNCCVQVSPRRLDRVGWLRSAISNCVLRMAYRLGGSKACCAIYRRYYSTHKHGSISLN